MIPTALTDLPQWVVWRYERRGDNKPTKVPHQIDGTYASSIDPSSWTTYESALAAEDFAGPGFVFTADDGFAGIDLDDCIADGEIAPWANAILRRLDCYAEISPSGNGLKIWVRGSLPRERGMRANVEGGGRIEAYSHSRFFTVTGDALKQPESWRDETEALAQLCAAYMPAPQQAAPAAREPGSKPRNALDRAISYADATPGAVAGNAGHDRTFELACRLVNGFDLDETDAMRVIQGWNAKCDPPWSDRELAHKIREATKSGGARGYMYNEDDNGAGDLADFDSEGPSAPSIAPQIVSGISLAAMHQKPREVIVDGILRKGETLNIIAAPKVGKSWLAIGLGFAVAAGSDWLGEYKTQQGGVLLIDNELHAETLACRLSPVADSMGLASIPAAFDVDPLRGRLVGLHQLEKDYLSSLRRGRYSLIILDAYYRFLPEGVSENDNAQVAQLYNVLDRAAHALGCAFAMVHHTSKGYQGGKGTTDVGAGAGALSRAADSHMVIRPHAESGYAVMDCETRSFPPFKSASIRWNFPGWEYSIIPPKVMQQK